MADRYLVATGNWDSTDSWSDSSGGSPGASVPTSSDIVYLDASSGSVTLTVNVSAECDDFICTGFTGTVDGTSALGVYGSFLLVSGMTWSYTGALTFKSTSSETITSGTKTYGGNVSFNGSGGSWTLQDAMDCSSKIITLTQGSLDTNDETVTCATFSSSNSNTRTLTLGSSTINITSSWSTSTKTNLTFDAETSTISCSGSSITFNTGGLAFYDVSFLSAGVTLSGTNTFNNLTFTGTTSKASYVSINYAAAYQTVSGTLTIAGNSVVNRIFLYSSSPGTASTINAEVVSISYANFRDIIAGGTASPFTGTSLGDCLGNTNITFDAEDTVYWVGGSGNWSDNNEWSSSSGGTPGDLRVPLPQDTVVFDANSFGSGSLTVTADMPRAGADADFSAVTNSPTLDIATSVEFYGTVTFGTMSVTGNFNMGLCGRGTETFTPTASSIAPYIYVTAPGGSYTLQDDLEITSSVAGFQLIAGTFDANDYDITAYRFSGNFSTLKTLIMGNGTWTITGSSSAWTTGSGTTITCENSKIVFNDATSNNKTFDGGSKTFYDIQFTGAGTGKLIIVGSNEFHDFTIDTEPKEVNFTAGTTTTLTTAPSWQGSAGNLIKITSVTSAQHTLSCSSGSTNCDYLDLSYSVATGGASWYGGANSTDNGNNEGWFETIDYPDAFELALTLNGPVVSISVSSSPSVLELISSLEEPTELFDFTEVITVLELVSSLHDPSIFGGSIVSPSVLELTAEIQSPEELFDFTEVVSALSLSSSLEEPTELFDFTEVVSALSLSSSLENPVINYDMIFGVSAVNLSFLLNSPQINFDWKESVSALELSSSVSSPSYLISPLINVSALTLVSELKDPTILYDLTIPISAIALNLELLSPSTRGIKSHFAYLKRLSLNAREKRFSMTANVKDIDI